jgi:hypothetical protein
MAVQFHYDAQLRRFVTQFIRMVSNFQVEFGKDQAGVKALQTVPVYYGDPSRQASQILRKNSENTLNAVPAMAAYISALTYERDRVQNPYHEGKLQVRERTYDPITGNFMNTQDGLYTVERLMPAPYKLTMKLDIWTSNREQKHQIIEQIAPWFNPGLEIQSTDNYVDWTSLSVVLLTDVSYSSRTVPMGGEDPIDIASLTFDIPIWLTSPAKVKKMGVVSQIVANIFDDNGDINADFFNNGQPISRQKFRPYNYSVMYVGGVLKLVVNDNESGVDIDVPEAVGVWRDLVAVYGTLTNGISQVRLQFPYPDEQGYHEIVGTVAYDPNNPTVLLYSPFSNSLPANTLPPVNAIIDPYNVVENSPILSPSVGTRYLILNPIGDAYSESAAAWAGTLGTNLVAKANDIIEWNGSYWQVSFDSQEPSVQYVTNLNTTSQYLWNGTSWVKSVEGIYQAGEWSLVL